MKLFKWDGSFGMWTLIESKYFNVQGTTPRNADVFQIYVDIGVSPRDISIWTTLGKPKSHPGVILWWGEKSWQKLKWVPKNCDCLSCLRSRPIPPEILQAMYKAMTDPNIPTRKLPPRD